LPGGAKIGVSIVVNAEEGSENLDVCRRGFDGLLREGREGAPKMMSIGLHPRWAGQAGRTSALREFIEHALGQPDVWFATREQIARHWLQEHPGLQAA
jgi:hypothetical protein